MSIPGIAAQYFTEFEKQLCRYYWNLSMVEYLYFMVLKYPEHTLCKVDQQPTWDGLGEALQEEVESQVEDLEAYRHQKEPGKGLRFILIGTGTVPYH